MGEVGDSPLVDRYLAALRDEFPRLRVIEKQGDRLSRWIDGALRIVTLGGQSAYMSRYVTTLGSTVYVPSGWDDREDTDRYITLRHEAIHLRQFRRYGRFGMAVLYLIPILPLGLAIGRARLEWEAYRETLLATAELHGLAALGDEELRAHVLRQFTSASYGWMWPFPATVGGWMDKAIAEIRVECEATDV